MATITGLSASISNSLSHPLPSIFLFENFLGYSTIEDRSLALFSHQEKLPFPRGARHWEQLGEKSGERAGLLQCETMW